MANTANKFVGIFLEKQKIKATPMLRLFVIMSVAKRLNSVTSLFLAVI